MWLFPCINWSYHIIFFEKFSMFNNCNQVFMFLYLIMGHPWVKKWKGTTSAHFCIYVYKAHQQKFVEDIRLIMNNVCLFIFDMHWILDVLIKTCFNSRLWSVAFSIANMFTKIIQLWSHELLFSFHIGAILTLITMH